MKTTKQAALTIFGSTNLGGYCDPITGECIAIVEKENLMTTAIDPVCKMEVEIKTARYKSEHAGQTYYFCSAGCQRSFEDDPHQYLPEDHHGQDHNHEGH
jgi:YHS domain-containing protein